MTFTHRLLSFVPPLLLSVIPAFSQLQGKLELVSGSTYQVAVIPSVDWSPPQSITNSAQITLRAATGKFNITDFQNQTGKWGTVGTFSAPAEAPGYDYFSFYLTTPLVNLNYQTGQAVPLFSFKNSNGCGYIELVDNQNDPFMPPNSLNVNIGNSFTVLGAGIGQNAYAGNSAESSADCPLLDIYTTALQNPVPCPGDRTEVMVQAFGGQPPYEVNWENLTTGNWGGGQIEDFEGATLFTDMIPGNYLFTIEDNRDSTAEINLFVAQPQPLKLQVDAYDASCNGSLDGLVLVEYITGGTTNGNGYQYYWSTDPTVSS